MRKRFTEEQIVGILKKAEAGLKVAEPYRKHGTNERIPMVFTSTSLRQES